MILSIPLTPIQVNTACLGYQLEGVSPIFLISTSCRRNNFEVLSYQMDPWLTLPAFLILVLTDRQLASWPRSPPLPPQIIFVAAIVSWGRRLFTLYASAGRPLISFVLRQLERYRVSMQGCSPGL